MNAFFIGIGGMGMSGLAKILHSAGFKVAGSDRNLEGDYCKRLIAMGVKIYPQDGKGPELFMQETGLKANEFKIVKSTAVESTVPDVVTAERLGIEQIMRSDLLAQMFNAKKGIAIGGTAGKTTTTGLVAWVLDYCGLQPSCAVGGIISGLDTNAFQGAGEHFVIEADESDGSIVKYRPHISVVTNISHDHKTIDELEDLFLQFFEHTDDDGLRLVCADDAHAMELCQKCSKKVKTYGLAENADYKAENIKYDHVSVSFDISGVHFDVKLPGEHNMNNILAAVAIGQECGLSLEAIADSMKAFGGMKRRFEKVGVAGGITVIDDFAHNPAEIAAAMEAARKASDRCFFVYQPHGFGPTNFTKDQLVKVFSTVRDNEYLYLDEIYYGGGTVEKNISSKDLIEAVGTRVKNASCPGSRDKIVDNIVEKAKDGDTVLVMGARDVNKICPIILNKIEARR
jgi:UDP-N-acetylmuramate--alanine ligase